MKTGILGGTFDPIHNGHIMIAAGALKTLGLDEVLFMPAARSPFKQEDHITPVGHRVRMIELAIAGTDGFRLSTIEIEREGISYTADTLESMKKDYGDATELFFITGLDSLLTLPHWKDPEKILRYCRLVTVRRPGYDGYDLDKLEDELPGIRKNLVVLDEPQLDISSTDIRERVSEGLSIADLVPKVVEQYITEHHIYKEGK